MRQEAEFPDCIMLSYSFRISLLKHAILVTDSCEAFRTMWKKNQKPDLANLLGIVTYDKRNWLTRLNQNGKEPGYIGFRHDITNEQSVPGLRIAPKATILSGISELGYF
jgi:hypothetical protein